MGLDLRVGRLDYVNNRVFNPLMHKVAKMALKPERQIALTSKLFGQYGAEPYVKRIKFISR